MTKYRHLAMLFAMGSSLLVFTSCENTTEEIETLSQEDAVELIESALQSRVGGIISNLEDIVEELVVAVASGEICDSLYETTIEDNFQGNQVQAEYTSNISYTLTCNNFDIPQAATFSSITSSIFNSDRIESDDDASFDGNASGLQPTSSTISIVGNITRSGTQVLIFREQLDVTSTFTFDITNVEISKQEAEINSGSGGIALTGSAYGEEFSFDGTLVFNGGKTATLTFNGMQYPIDWN